MASNKHAQIRYKVLDDCFSNFRRKFYFDDLIERCNEALRELYGEEHTGIKTRTLRADISYIRDRAGEAGVEVEVKDDGNGLPPEIRQEREQKEQTHVGLKNIERRLDLMCHGTLTIQNKTGQGTIATIRIPKQIDP